MSVLKIMSPAERAEVEKLVINSYIDAETGATRPTVLAKAEFASAVREADRIGRGWASLLIADCIDHGLGLFAARLWKRRDAFTAQVGGVRRSRSLRRGKKMTTETGERVDVQASLLDWSMDDLTDAIAAEAARAKEARINLETYAALIRLVKESGAEPISTALELVGMTLDEYLASADSQAA